MGFGMATSWHTIPSHQRRMMGFLLAAILLHSLVLFGLQVNGVGVRPELPDWMNIRLVAGIDESVDIDMVPKPRPQPVKPKPVETNKTSAKEPVTEKAEPQAQPQAQHFVKADSRPFEFENPKPFYPAAARRRGMQGTVLLGLEVDTRGKVSFIRIKKSSGYRLLDEAAIDTVRRWRFIPAKENDTAVRSVVEVPVKFSLQDS